MTIEIKAHIAGRVFRIEKSPGDAVAIGDAVVTLESMKMEVPVESPADGTVREVCCAEGDEVAEEQVLAVVE
jgi:acetyl-CoA carboxylase biotin carboxyl carrier protein